MELTPEEIALSAMAAVTPDELRACKQAAAGRNPWLIHPTTGRTVLLQDILHNARRTMDGQQ